MTNTADLTVSSLKDERKATPAAIRVKAKRTRTFAPDAIHPRER